MSGTSSQRVRKIASPSLKQGPMRATFPFALRQNSSPSGAGGSMVRSGNVRQGGSPTLTNTRSSNGRKGSPSSSPTPTWVAAETHKKTPRSPDHRASPDNRTSPSSPFIKDKARSMRHSPVPQIKRTSSLDTYLKGEWPRDTVVPYHTLTVPGTENVPRTEEKATQTPEEFWDEIHERKKRGSHIRSSSLGNGDTLKKEQIKARLAKSKEGSRTIISGIQRNSPVQGNHAAITTATVSTTTVAAATIHSKAVAIPHIPKQPTIQVRGSVEGLSQEIETLVLMSTSGSCEELNRPQDPTPDGHRAPIADLLRTRSVDTQTPLGPKRIVHAEEEEEEYLEEEVEEEGGEEEDEAAEFLSDSSKSSTPSEARCSPESPQSLPIIPGGQIDTSRPSSLTEGLKDNSDCVSPNLKSFSFAREPPDGCEKIKIVHEENISGGQGAKHITTSKDSLFCPIKKPSEKYCIPSKVSAFCTLVKPYVLQSTLREPVVGATSHASQTIEGQ